MRNLIRDSWLLGNIIGETKFASQTVTLTAGLTLTTKHPTLSFLDPGGAARDITLPAVTRGLTFIIVNTADADEDLTVKNAGGTQIEIVAQSEMGIFVCDGATWRGMVTPASVGGVIRQDLALEVINKTGSDIAADKLVAVSSLDTTSGKPKIVLADADVAAHDDVWVTTAAIANNAQGKVYKSALSAATLNTNSVSSAGDPVYLDTTAGGFAVTAPTGVTARVHPVGMVVVKSATVGQILWSIGPIRIWGDNEHIRFSGITAGVQAANKAVVADANVNTGVSKVTQLHIGASGSEVQINATPAEINAAADVSSRLVSIADAATYAVLVANSTKTHVVPNLSQEIAIQLPTEAAGLEFEFVYGGVAADTVAWVIKATAGANFFLGGLVHLDTDADAAGDEVVMVAGNGSSNAKLTINVPQPGTIVRVICNGTNWIVSGYAVAATAPAFADLP